MSSGDPILNFLVVDIGVFHFNGMKYFHAARKYFEEDRTGDSLLPFCLLATTAAEIFLKIIIAVNICKNLKGLEKDNANIKTIVCEELKNCGHDLKKMIEKAQIKNQLKISDLEEINNDIVSDYRFLYDGKPVFFKNSESIRFASLAKKPDVAQSGLHFSQQIIDFLEEANKLSISLSVEVTNLYKSS